MTLSSAALGTATPPLIRSRSLDNIVRAVDLELRSVSNRESSGSVPCQMPYVTGTHERTACGRAMSSAYDVIEEAHKKASGDKADAMKRSLEILHPDSAERFGNTLQVHWTILGTLHEALVNRAIQFPDDPVPKAMLPKVVASITELAVKAGRCKGIADGTYHGDSKTLKLADAVIAAKKLVTECATKMGGEALLCNIAEAILPKPMKDSIAERLPHLVDVFDKPGSSTDTQQILHKNMMDGLARTLRIHIENGGSESYINAILHLLKLPEYVVQGEQGKAGDTPVQDDAPFDPLRQARELNGNGAPIAISHVPVTVKNGQSQQPHPPLDLKDLRNLLNDQFQRGYALGDANGYQRAIQEQLTRSEARADRLEKELERLRAWVNGTGLTRNPNDPTLDKASSSVHSLDLESLDLLNIRPPRQTEVAQRTRQLDTDDKQKDIRTDQRSSLLLDRGDGNGNDGTRRAPPGAEDQTDGRSSPPTQPTNPKRPPAGDQLDLSRSDRNLQQKSDDSTQRTLRQMQLNRSSESDKSKDPKLGESGNTTGDSVYKELQHYFKEFGHGDRWLPADPFRPDGPRHLMSRRGQAVPFGQADRTHSPADFIDYRNARAVNAGKPFVAPYSGARLPEGEAAPAELDRLLEEFRGNLKPSHVLESRNMAPAPRSRDATPTPVSPLQQAFKTFRDRNTAAPVAEGKVPTGGRSDSAVALTSSFEQDRGDELVEVSDLQIVVERISKASPLMLPPRDWLRPEALRSGGVERTRSVSVSSDDSSDGYEYGSRIISDSKVSKARQPHRDRDPRAAAIDTLRASSSLFRDLGISPVVSTLTRSETLATRQGEEASVLRRAALEGAKVSGGQVSRQQSVEDVLSDLDEKWGLVDENVDSGNESPTPLIESPSESPLEAIWKSGIADRPEFANVRASLSKNTLEALRQAQVESDSKQQGAA